MNRVRSVAVVRTARLGPRAARLLAALVVMASTAHAQDVLEPELPSRIQAPFQLYLNHVDKGEVIVVLEDGDVFVRRRDLVRAGLSVPQARAVEVDGEVLLSLKSMSPPLVWELDERKIELRIVAPPELLPVSRINLSTPPPEIEYRKDPSAWLNYAPRVTDLVHFDMYEEMGLSVKGHLLFNSMYFSNELAPVRGLTNLTLDDPKHLRRATLGDTFVATSALGGARFVGGASIARVYELDPYLVRTPSLGYYGSTVAPATLDVYVNGARVRSEPLRPGRFELNNLRVANGDGVATYVVRDVWGNEQAFNVPFYVANRALAKGFTEFAYGAGALRDAVGTQSFDYGDGAIFGQHRLGVTDHFTIGMRGEASETLLSLGPATALMLPVGQLELEVAASRDRSFGEGAAALAAYAYMSRWLSTGLHTRFMSDEYTNLSLPARQDRPTIEAGAFVTIPIVTAWNVTLQGLYSRYRDLGHAVQGHLQSQLRLNRELSLFLTASQARFEGGSHPYSIMLTLNKATDTGHNRSVSVQVVDDQPGVRVDANKSLPVGEGYGYRASGLVAEQSTVDGQLQYQTLFGRYTAGYTYFEDPNQDQHHTSLEAAGAIAVVPGVGVFPTLPIQDGFAVIRLEGADNVRGYVNNQEIGRTDRNGNLLAPNLISYYGNRLSIAEQDVPMSYELKKTELTLAPPYRGVAVANFPISVPHFYRGTLRVLDGERTVVPKYGELRVEGPIVTLASPLGELGEFEIDGLEPGTYPAKVIYGGGTCELALKVPDSRATVVEVGEVVCKRAARPAPASAGVPAAVPASAQPPAASGAP